MENYLQGDQVRLVRPHVTPFITIPPKETGEVIDVDPETGDLTIKLDSPFDALEHRRNIICVLAADTGDLEKATTGH